MSARAEYINGVFEPLDRVTDAVSGMAYRVFSEEELRSLTEDSAWLKTADANEKPLDCSER